MQSNLTIREFWGCAYPQSVIATTKTVRSNGRRDCSHSFIALSEALTSQHIGNLANTHFYNRLWWPASSITEWSFWRFMGSSCLSNNRTNSILVIPVQLQIHLIASWCLEIWCSRPKSPCWVKVLPILRKISGTHCGRVMAIDGQNIESHLWRNVVLHSRRPGWLDTTKSWFPFAEIYAVRRS